MITEIFIVKKANTSSLKQYEPIKNQFQNQAKFFSNSFFLSYLVAPVIYSMVVPLALLDVAVCFYQMVCFPIYKIPKVIRTEYVVLDRYKLKYLSWLERINCAYCGYFNGVIAFVREVAARTEQYFCPIKHAHQIKGFHSRYKNFFNYDDGASYQERLIDTRKKLRAPEPIQ